MNEQKRTQLHHFFINVEASLLTILIILFIGMSAFMAAILVDNRVDAFVPINDEASERPETTTPPIIITNPEDGAVGEIIEIIENTPGSTIFTTNFNTPTGSTDSEDPIEPEDPEDPTNPVDPVDPTDPTDPTDPVDPVDPIDPVDPVDPTDPEPEECSDPITETATITVGCYPGHRTLITDMAIVTNDDPTFSHTASIELDWSDSSPVIVDNFTTGNGDFWIIPAAQPIGTSSEENGRSWLSDASFSDLIQLELIGGVLTPAKSSMSGISISPNEQLYLNAIVDCDSSVVLTESATIRLKVTQQCIE